MYGKNWKKVENYIGTRTGTQIRSHAQKFFNRIRKEYSTEDPSKFVIDNMSDETIKRIVLEHCEEEASNKNEDKVLFLITKDNKADKKPSKTSSPAAKNSPTIKSAFKRFKKDENEQFEKPEGSKMSEDIKNDVNHRLPILRPKPMMPSIHDPLSNLHQLTQLIASHPLNQISNQNSMSDLVKMLMANVNQPQYFK